MRLWHYKLIPFLPKSQLLSQWRELNSIFKKKDKHILIDYVYLYPKEHLLVYSIMVIREMENRNINITNKSIDNYIYYFGKSIFDLDHNNLFEPFPKHHTNRYLLQCFYNLQEKYDRGQKDFRYGVYLDLEDFIKRVVFNEKTCRV